MTVLEESIQFEESIQRMVKLSHRPGKEMSAPLSAMTIDAHARSATVVSEYSRLRLAHLHVPNCLLLRGSGVAFENQY